MCGGPPRGGRPGRCPNSLPWGTAYPSNHSLRSGRKSGGKPATASDPRGRMASSALIATIMPLRASLPRRSSRTRLPAMEKSDVIGRFVPATQKDRRRGKGAGRRSWMGGSSTASRSGLQRENATARSYKPTCSALNAKLDMPLAHRRYELPGRACTATTATPKTSRDCDRTAGVRHLPTISRAARNGTGSLPKAFNTVPPAVKL